jgi:hypothetical protein
MSMDWAQLYQVIGRAVPAQGYRPVNLDTLVVTPIQFSNLDEEVNTALAGALNDPNWVNVAAQLSHLKVRGLAGVWLRRKGHYLDLVYVYSFSGVLQRSRAREFNEWAWDVTKNLKGMLGRFKLDGNLATVMGSVASALDGAPAPTENDSPQLEGDAPEAPAQPLPAGEDSGPIGPQLPAQEEPAVGEGAAAKDTAGWRKLIAGLLRVVLDVHFADAPRATMVTVGIGGLQQELIDDVQSVFSEFHHEAAWGLRPSRLLHVAVDGTDLSVHGRAEVGAFKVSDFGEALRFLAGAG